MKLPCLACQPGQQSSIAPFTLHLTAHSAPTAPELPSHSTSSTTNSKAPAATPLLFFHCPVFRSSPLDDQPYSKYRSIPADRSLLFFASYRRCSAIPLPTVQPLPATSSIRPQHRPDFPSPFYLHWLWHGWEHSTTSIPSRATISASLCPPDTPLLHCSPCMYVGYPPLLTGESLWIETTTKVLQSRYVQFSSGNIINKPLARSQPDIQLLSFTYTCVPSITSP